VRNTPAETDKPDIFVRLICLSKDFVKAESHITKDKSQQR
jgi:hypothetical protein